DPLGYAYVTGVARSANFPTTPGVFGPGPVGALADTFIAKFTPDGDVKYSTLLGGSGCEGLAIALGGDGYDAGLADAFVTGRDPMSIPGVPVVSPAVPGGLEAFVIRLSTSGAALHYLAYIGGSGLWDMGFGIAVDRMGDAHVIGTTDSPDFHTT